jgi:hypothetical protein
MENVQWVATLSDGTTAVEHRGSWAVIPGKRKPWVRLCNFAAQEGLHLTSLRLNIDDKTIHMPRDKFDRFNLGKYSQSPKSYSLQYHLEVDDLMAKRDSTEFVDLAAHYPLFTVHYIQDVTNGNNSWIVVTDGDTPMAISPSRKD